MLFNFQGRPYSTSENQAAPSIVWCVKSGAICIVNRQRHCARVHTNLSKLRQEHAIMNERNSTSIMQKKVFGYCSLGIQGSF